MTFLPIVERELRTRSRQWPTYWARVGVGAVGTLLCAQLLGVGEVLGSPAEAGRYAFQGLVVLGFIVGSLGCLATADSISRERRDETLGLLFLTRVRGLDILLGKFASNSLFMLCSLVAFLPVMMLPVLAGGVSGAEALQVGLMLMVATLLSLMAGLLASTWHVQWSKAAGTALALVAGLLLLPLILQIGFEPTPTVGLLSPIYGLAYAGKPDATFWLSVGLVIAIVVILFIRAWRGLLKALRNDRQDKPSEEAAAGVARPSQALVSHRPLHPVGDEPIRWLLTRQRGILAMIWTGTLLGIFFSGFRSVFPVFRGSAGVGWSVSLSSISFALTAITGGLFAWAASRFFFEAKRSGEFELLVTTPEGARTMVREQWQYLRRAFRWPVVVMFLPLLFSIFVTAAWSFRMRGPDWAVFYAISHACSVANTVLAVAAFCWTGMWHGLHSRTQSLAVLQTVAWVKLLPFLLGYLSMFLVRFLAAANSSWLTVPSVPSYFWMSLFTQFLSLAFCVWLIWWMRRRLLGDLREPGAMPLAGLFSWPRSAANIFHRMRHWTPS
jgi:hypothetical protein